MAELWRTETSSWSYDDTSSDEEGHKGVLRFRGKSRNADHGRNARKISQVEKGIPNLGLENYNSNAKTNVNDDLLQLEKRISGLEIEQINEFNLSGGKNTNKDKELGGSEHQRNDTEAVMTDAPARRDDASVYKPMGLVLKLGGNQSDSQCSTNTAVTDDNMNHANDMSASKEEHGTAKTDTQLLAADLTTGDHLREIEGNEGNQSTNHNKGSAAAVIHNKNTEKHESASTKETGEAETDAQSLTGDFTTGEHLKDIEGNEESQSINGIKGSAAAEMSPLKDTETFKDVDAADLAGNGPVSGHRELHASADIELLETDKPTKLEISTTIELTGDLKDVELDQKNDCHFGSAATGAVPTVKAESSQVVQAAEGSNTAKEEDAAKAALDADLAADHAHASSPDAVEGTADEEKTPAPEEATSSEHVADIMEVDDDQTVQNGKAAAPVNVGWLGKIRNLFYV